MHARWPGFGAGVLALGLVAGVSQAQETGAWLPEGTQTDSRGLPVGRSLVSLSVGVGLMTGFLSDSLMEGNRTDLAGLGLMAAGLAIQPGFDKLRGRGWKAALGRSLGRLGTLALAGVGYSMMVFRPRAEQDGWAALLHLSAAGTGVLCLWEMMGGDEPLSGPPDPVPETRGAAAMPGAEGEPPVDLSLGPLIIGPPPGAEEGKPPALGLSLSGYF